MEVTKPDDPATRGIGQCGVCHWTTKVVSADDGATYCAAPRCQEVALLAEKTPTDGEQQKTFRSRDMGNI